MVELTKTKKSFFPGTLVRACEVLAGPVWILLIIVGTTLIGWGNVPLAPLFLFGVGLGVPVLAFFGIPLIYAGYTYIRYDDANFLWLTDIWE